MHPEVVDDHAGACPICKMPLEPIRLDTAWSCPVHAVIIAAEPGRCRICGRELVHVTVAVAWTCPDLPGVDRLEPGACVDGSPARIKYSPRPHGNHNPQYGGQFFMAPDNWHHVEGAYPRAGLFQLHIYDDYSKPLSAAQLRQVNGRVTTPAGDSPLMVSSGQDVLEARVGALALPAQVTAKVRFTPDGQEHRFDFTFATYSHPSSREPSVTPGAGRPAADADDLRVKAETTYAVMLAQLRERSRELGGIIERGAFGEVYVPAFAAKDLALAIDAHATDAPPPLRMEIDGATSRLVRAAWMLDAAGDVGNADDIKDAFSRFVAALADLNAAVERLPKRLPK
jgi:hypothetical protein